MLSAHKEPQAAQSVPRNIRTRRNLWLSSNPSYFDQADHALSLPLAYDRLVRVYQSAAERQAEGRQQGWAKMLEGALVRGEAKRDQAIKDRQQTREKEKAEQDRAQPPDKISGGKKKALKPLPEEVNDQTDTGLNGTDDGTKLANTTSRWDAPLGVVPADEILESAPDPMPVPERESARDCGTDPAASLEIIDGLSKEQASRRWQELLKARFVAGDDEEFIYADVDGESDQDVEWQESQRESDWFENEAESWIDPGRAEKTPECETGIQDF